MWVKGHLQNQELGGLGESSNLTPLTHKANNAMSNHFEGKLKEANGFFGPAGTLRKTVSSPRELQARGLPDSQIKNIHDGIKNLNLKYEVKVSDNVKFENSPNPFERSIREHLVFNAEYKGMNDDLRAYMRANGKSLPDIPVKGTRMDTISGKFSSPDGNGGWTPWENRPRIQRP
jgi:hypothetical protein